MACFNLPATSMTSSLVTASTFYITISKSVHSWGVTTSSYECTLFSV